MVVVEAGAELARGRPLVPGRRLEPARQPETMQAQVPAQVRPKHSGRLAPGPEPLPAQELHPVPGQRYHLPSLTYSLLLPGLVIKRIFPVLISWIPSFTFQLKIDIAQFRITLHRKGTNRQKLPGKVRTRSSHGIE